jgi:hypothetical protein
MEKTKEELIEAFKKNNKTIKQDEKPLQKLKDMLMQ